jgi:death-on-curing protein
VWYLTVGDVIAFNRAEVGGDALADFGLLESAVLRPLTTIGGLDAYPSVHEKAAALMHSLIRNHPFVDGNKRTAVVATFTFYMLNGWEVRAENADVVGLAVDVAEGHLDVATIAKRLAGWATRLELPEE